MIRFNHPTSGGSVKGLVTAGFLAAALGVAVSQTGSPSGYPNTGSPQDQTMGSPGAPTQEGGQANPSVPSQSPTDPTQSATDPTQAGSASSSASAASMNTGWRIRVCSEKTKAQSINFSLSPVPGSGQANQGGSSSSSGMTSGSGSASSGSSASGSASSGSSGSNASGSNGAGSTSPDLSSSGTSSSGANSPEMSSSGSSSSGAAMGPETATWTRGESTLIPLTGSLSDADKIRVEATPSEKNQKASVCLLYNDHVAKKLNFDDREVSTVKKTQTGECGC